MHAAPGLGRLNAPNSGFDSCSLFSRAHGMQITYAGGATSPLRGQGPCTKSVTLSSGERITGVSESGHELISVTQQKCDFEKLVTGVRESE
jgi:hypothetical protein